MGWGPPACEPLIWLEVFNGLIIGVPIGAVVLLLMHLALDWFAPRSRYK